MQPGVKQGLLTGEAQAAVGSIGRARSVFFSSIWLWSSAVLIFIAMITQQRALALLGFLTLCTAGGAWLWARYALKGVSYTRTLSADRVFPGEQVQLRVSVVNRKLLPLAWLDLEDNIPDRLRIVEQETVPSGIAGYDTLRITTAMRWYERVSWTFHLQCQERGWYTFNTVAMRSGDLFGFFSAREQFRQTANLMVYPQVVALDDLGIPPRHLFGDLRTRRMLIDDPSRTIGVRDYHPEDSIRHVHWNATARAQRLQTRVFEPSTAMQFGVFLNLDTFEHYWEGVDYEQAEYAIIVAASIAMRAYTEKQTVGMYANGVLGGSDQPLRVRPSRSPEQGHAMLSGLARLSPVASLSFPRLLRSESSRFPWGSTIVIVTALMTDALAAALHELHHGGHRLLLVPIREMEIPAVRGMVVQRVDTSNITLPRAQRRRYSVLTTVKNGAVPVQHDRDVEPGAEGDGGMDTGSSEPPASTLVSTAPPRAELDPEIARWARRDDSE